MAEVQAVFTKGSGKAAGCMITEGKLIKDCDIHVIRNGETIYTGKINSLRRVKEDVKEVSIFLTFKVLFFKCLLLFEPFDICFPPNWCCMIDFDERQVNVPHKYAACFYHLEEPFFFFFGHLSFIQEPEPHFLIIGTF